MNLAILAWGMPGTTELIIIAAIALLVFGRRLPDVARSVGKSIVEFKKGLKDVKGEIDVQSQTNASAPPKLDQTTQPAPPSPVESNKSDPPASS